MNHVTNLNFENVTRLNRQAIVFRIDTLAEGYGNHEGGDTLYRVLYHENDRNHSVTYRKNDEKSGAGNM